MTDIERIVDATNARSKHGGGWMGHCPAHDDRTPSLSIDLGDTGKPIVKCWSGCSQEAVIDSLKAVDAWPVTGQGPNQEDLENARRRSEQRKADRQRDYAQAAALASKVWKAAGPSMPDHSYLARKQVAPTETLKQIDLATLVELIGYHPQVKDVPLTDGQVLIVPVVVDGQISTIEMIDQNGLKPALAKGRKQEGYWSTRKLPNADSPGLAFLVGEGVATCLSSEAATGHPAVAALSCGNLLSVARQMRTRYPKADITILADLLKATGEPDPHAIEAAREIGGKLAAPDFGPDRPEGMTDFNDMQQKEGPAAVKACILAALPGQQGPVATVLDEWPAPLPLINHQESEPYPLDALPGIIGAAVHEVVGFVQCPVALAACSALAVVSTVGQGLVDVRRDDGLEGPASLFFLALADSGERKTTVDNHFSGPIKQWERDQATLAKPDLVKFEAEKSAWEAKKSGQLAAIQHAAKGGKDTTELEMLMVDLEMDKPESPSIPRLLFGDSTPEALAFALANAWPVGSVLASEAGIVFGGHAMGKDSVMRNLALLNTLWDGQPLRIDRKSGASYRVDGARLTMGLAVQPETVKSFLDASRGLARGIGFLARFLIAWPESTQGARMFKNPPSCWPDKERFHRQLSTLLSRPLDFDENGRLTPQMLGLSQEAKRVWIAFHDDVETELRPGRDMAEARDVASKAADNAARLAALFHVFENSLGWSIGSDHMTAAARIVSWHLYEARRFIGEIALPVEQTNALKLDAWLIEYCRREKTNEVSTRHLQQIGPYATRKKDDLFPALEELTEAGRLRVAKDGQKKLVKINPALLEG